jgi:hypothetical protein
MKTKFLLFILGLLLAINGLAQIGGGLIKLEPEPGQEYIDRMDYIFEHVDKSKITTGLLSDYGLQMVESLLELKNLTIKIKL